MKKVIVFIAVLVAIGLAGSVSADYAPVWFDGYDASTSSNDINFQYAARQGGTPATYNESPVDTSTTNWYSQIVSNGAGNLLLANDGGAPGWGQPGFGSTLATPNMNFSGVVGTNVIGTKVSLAVNVNNAAGAWSYAAVNFGSSLTQRDGAGTIGVSLVQDNTSGGLGSFFQLYRGAELFNFSVPFNAGAYNNVEVFFTDLQGDGNPWDGGNMAVGVAVNGTTVGGFNTSGWTQNYITLEGSWNFAGGLGIHNFDNLTVYSSPVPEPATMALLGFGAIAALRRSRK